MTVAGEVTVNVSGRDVNLAALLGRLEAQMRQTDQQGIRLAQTTAGTFTAAQQKAANGAIQEAQALARAAVAVGDNARAHQILVQALGNSAGATDRAVAGLTAQIGRLQSGQSIAAQFGDSLKSSLLGIVGPAALAGAALGALRSAITTTEEAFKLKASLDQTQASIRVLLNGVRDSNTVFAEANSFGQRYKLTQQEISQAIQSSIPILRQSKASTEDVLNVLARLQVLNPEETFAGAARALSELRSGDITSLSERFNIARSEANKLKAEIQGGADVVQVMDRFLTKAGVSTAALDARAAGAAGKMREMAVETEKFQLALAGGAGGPGLALLEGRLNVVRGATRLLSGDFQSMETSIRDTAQRGSNELRGIVVVADLLSGAIARVRGEQEQGTASGGAWAQSNTIAATAVEQHSVAAAFLAAIQADARNESILLAQASQSEAIASQTAGQNAELQAIQTQILAAQTQNAANAFLNLNPGIDQAGIRAAVNAGLIPALTGRIAELTLQIQKAKAELGQATGGGGGPGLSAASFATSQEFFNRNQREAAKAAAAAQRDQTLAVGTTAQKMALLNRELADAKRLYGEGSAQAIRAQTAIDQAVDRSTKKSKGAGATKLTDQQKLNNTLLADQERYQDQAEQAERNHAKRLLDIEAEFQKRSLEQQRSNEVSKRQSRADFYDNLTSATKDVGNQVAQTLSQSYEQAYAEAQKIAQAGNQKLADDYLRLKQRQIAAELEFQKRLAEARKNKDKDEVARLEAVHKLQTEANAEEEKQLLAGGDTNVNARNEALTEEQRNFEEQQGKIATSAENAADRKIAAAQRSGKAIDAENVSLREQEDILNRIGGRGAGPGAAGGGTSAPAPPTAQAEPVVPTTEAAPVGLGPALDGLKAAINAVEKATSDGADKVARAVSARAIQV